MKEKIINILSICLGGVDVKDSSNLSDFNNWDSMAHVNILIGLEEEFNIEINEEDFLNIRTVEQIIKLIQQYDL
jgi:acyl carrier protein